MTSVTSRAKPGQLTAMISSTALDLPEHRAAVKEACVSAGVFPIGMEHLPARDASGITVSLEMVDKADIYLGIYAWRYGWVPDGKTVSITEMEFDRAVELKTDGKLHEILIFTAHDDHPCTKKDVEADKGAQEKLVAFKMKAATGRVRKEFKSVEELRRLVSEALREFQQREQVLPHPSTSIRHNLPTLQPFFGREKELKQIANALDPDSRTWGALIDGPGGMGKTSLAIRAAYAAPPDVFKRIIFISLKTRELDDDGLRDLSGFLVSGLAELLNELARELGRDDIAKAVEDQRPRLLLEALRGTQTLLVLDNLESLLKPERDILFTFVKRLPVGCKAILTSRKRIGSGAEELILEKLSQQAVLDTLVELATHNPFLAKTSEAERLDLFHETGGKPLLLRWTAGQLGRGHCLTFSDALHFLRSCPEGNDPLEFIFGDLVEDFSEAETKVLCALTYFTLPAKVEHVAAVAEFSEPDTDRVLRSVANRSLAVPTDELKAFTLVPMVADFLRKKKPEVVVETGNRLEKRAYALIIENGYQNYDRFPHLEAAWPGIAPALPLFLATDNAHLQTVCEALDYFLDFSGKWDAWLSLSGKAEEIAARARDFRSAARRAHNAGWIHYLRQEAAKLIECAKREASFLRAAKADPCEQASAIRLHGLGLHLQKNDSAAIENYLEAIRLYRSVPSDKIEKYPSTNSDIAIVLNYISEAHRSLGNLQEAEKSCREALEEAKHAQFDEGVACFTGDLATLALDREDWSTAEVLARQALPLSEAVHRQELVAWQNFRLAYALTRQGKAVEALPHALRAVKIYTRLAHPKLADAQAILTECEGLKS